MKTDQIKIPTAPADYPYELIERCRRGDHRAQLQVYKLYYRPVFCVCMQMTSDPEVAEGIMHESFLLAFENIDSYPGNISFAAWIQNYIKISAYECTC